MHPIHLAVFAKYLPSKKFLIIIGGSIALILIVLFSSSHFGSKGSFNTKAPVSSAGTVNDVVSRDSNQNGIPDWEESLWGLNPTGDGAANKKIIDDKKVAANIVPSDPAVGSNSTDAFSQQILSTILALHQSGSLSPEVIAKVSASIGDSLDAKHTTAHMYTVNDLTISTQNPAAATLAYKKALKGIVDQYADIDLGSETMIMTSGFGAGGDTALKQLEPLAQAYVRLGKQIISLPTPKAVSQNAVDLANANIQIGTSLIQIENIYSDALGGMVGMGDYTKANALSDRATATLAAYFAN
jgi:hypothetical protein